MLKMLKLIKIDKINKNVRESLKEYLWNVHVIPFLNKNNCLGVAWTFSLGLNFAIK